MNRLTIFLATLFIGMYVPIIYLIVFSIAAFVLFFIFIFYYICAMFHLRDKYPPYKSLPIYIYLTTPYFFFKAIENDDIYWFNFSIKEKSKDKNSLNTNIKNMLKLNTLLILIKNYFIRLRNEIPIYIIILIIYIKKLCQFINYKINEFVIFLEENEVFEPITLLFMIISFFWFLNL